MNLNHCQFNTGVFIGKSDRSIDYLRNFIGAIDIIKARGKMRSLVP
ncbi:MAG: hypothetical protein ACFCU5_15200 [Pleurocapsa sp.]